MWLYIIYSGFTRTKTVRVFSTIFSSTTMETTSFEVLRKLRSLRDQIFSAKKREGTRWLFEDYEEEAFEWMKRVSTKIRHMQYDPEDFLKDIQELQRDVSRGKKIAGLDQLHLDTLFEAVKTATDNLLRQLSTGTTLPPQPISSFLFYDPIGQAPIDIVTPTALVLASTERKSLTTLAGAAGDIDVTSTATATAQPANPLLAHINSNTASATVFPIQVWTNTLNTLLTTTHASCRNPNIPTTLPLDA